MGIIVEPLVSGISTALTSAHVTSTYSPAANALILVAVHDPAGLAAARVPEGHGTTFVFVGEQNLSSQTLNVYRALSTGALTAGATTLKFSVATAPINYSIIQMRNVSTLSTDGEGAIVQGSSGASVGSTATVITLAAFAAPGNVAYGAFGELSTSLMTSGAGFTTIHSTRSQILNQTQSLMTEWAQNNSTVGANSPSAANRVGIALEIKESTVSVSVGRKMMMGVGR